MPDLNYDNPEVQQAVLDLYSQDQYPVLLPENRMDYQLALKPFGFVLLGLRIRAICKSCCWR